MIIRIKWVCNTYEHQYNVIICQCMVDIMFNHVDLEM